MTTARENNKDKRELLHAKILSKFGDRLENFREVTLLSTDLPVEVTCKVHGPYQMRPDRALKWRGKGAPHCPGCNRRGPKPGKKYTLSPDTPERIDTRRRDIIKSLTSSEHWARHYKTHDISLVNWRKKVRAAIDVIEPSTDLDHLYQVVADQMVAISEWIKSEVSTPYCG